MSDHILWTGHTGPVHGPAFLWMEVASWDEERRTLTMVDKAIDVLKVYAVECAYGRWSKFLDDGYWRSDYTWGGTGTHIYARHFSPEWSWIRSDGVLLERAPGPSYAKREMDDPVREGLRLLLRFADKGEPFIATKQPDVVKAKLEALNEQI